MPRGNPNIAKAGKKTQFGAVGGYSAVEAKKKSDESKARNKEDLKNMTELARENTSNPELIDFFERLKTRARHSDSSYELLLKLLGMLLKTQIEVSAPLDDSIREMSEYFGQSKDSGTAKK